MSRYYIHIVDMHDKQAIRPIVMDDVPRVGDELRITNELFAVVKRVIWVLDERDPAYKRVNLGVQYESC